MRLEFKFRETAPASERGRVIEKVMELGADTVEPLFAAEADAELASLYKVEGVPEARADQAISLLDAFDQVEFAERTPARELMR